VRHFPAVPHDILPGVADLADALLMPYVADHPALIASQPLKLMEYLATRKPAIATNLPAAMSWADCCDVVASGDFSDRVCERLAMGPSVEQLSARARRLPSETWAAKAQQLASLIDGATSTRIKREAA